MSLLERVVLAHAERRLEPFRTQAAVAQGMHRGHVARYFPKIEECYARASYWHGTGRYHYAHQDGSRYSQNTETVMDVLGSITTAGGLKPHFDPWLPTEGKCRESVSLATARMHSWVFARVHLYKTDTLLYELGNLQYWVPLFLVLLLTWLSEKPFHGVSEFSRMRRRTPMMRSFQTWAGAIRKREGGRVISLGSVLRGKDIWSDIPGNHPLLFGISDKHVKTYRVAPFLRKAEVRTLELVPFASMTHIEVPLANVEETETFLKNNGVILPVLPLEVCDIYCSGQPLSQLMYV